MDKLPEHDKRLQHKGIHPDVEAAYEYGHKVSGNRAGSGLFYASDIREAFLAGISYEQDQPLF